jgi:broad specificity phosphatase PhoE
MKQTLLFIRHGQTTWNVEQRLPGQLPGIHLTDTGKKQAERLADALAVLPISAVISSPLERARETAEIIAQPRQLAIQFEADLMDIDVGHWAGQNHDELNKHDETWKAFVKNPTIAPPDVETFPQVQARAVAAIERWRAQEASGAYPAFVAHADVIKLLIAHYTGLEAGQAGKLLIDNASVSIVEVEDEKRPLIVAISWSPKPGWLKPPTSESQSLPTEESKTDIEKIAQEQ